MIRVTAVTLAICCVTISVTGCGDMGGGVYSQRRQYTHAILEVYDKIFESYELSRKDREETSKGFQMGSPGVMQRHFERISSINASRCPREFQQAFDEYLDAMKDLTGTIESSQGWVAWTANFFTAGGATLIPAFIKAPELTKKVRNAEFKMKRIAMEYGLTFSPTKNEGS